MPTLIIPADHSQITGAALTTFWDAVMAEAAANAITATIRFGYAEPQASVTVTIDSGTRYVSRVGATDITHPEHTIDDNLDINGGAFITMLQNLASNPNTVNTSESAKTLLLLFVSEGARFIALRRAICAMLQDSEVSTKGQYVKALVHVWGHLRSTGDHKVTLANSDWYFQYPGHAAAPVGICNMALAHSANTTDNAAYAVIRSLA